MIARHLVREATVEHLADHLPVERLTCRISHRAFVLGITVTIEPWLGHRYLSCRVNS